MTTARQMRAAVAADRSRRVRQPLRVTATQRREDALPVIYGDGCWCGEPFGHDWPGKAGGKPHPRNNQIR